MFCYFAECSNDLIDIKRELSDEEYKKIEECIKVISCMLVDKSRIEDISSSYKYLLDLIESLSNKNQYRVAKEIQNGLSQLLFVFRKFLDNWETDIKRKYGENSKELQIFKQAQAEEYDQYIEYRIMYQLRNYDQHCGNVISEIKAYTDENDNQCYKVYTDRDSLLKNYKKWKKPEKEFLNQQNEKIEIVSYIVQLNTCISRIYEKTMKIHFTRDLLLACASIVNAANEFENEEIVKVVWNEVEIDAKFWEQQTKSLNFIDLMVPLCKQILRLHIKNNLGVVKVLFYGKELRKCLGECAIEMEEGIVSKITTSQFVTLAGQKLIRLSMKLFMDTNEFYSVLVDARQNYSDLKILEADYSLFLSALCKK